MTLHRKTLVIIGATLLGLLVAFFFLTRFTLLRRFADHENQQARQQVQRASTALDNEIAQLNTISVDDASWDAAYDFVQQPNASFLNSNFPLTVLTELRLDLVVFLNASDHVVFQKFTRQNAEYAVPADVAKAILQPGLLVRHSEYADTNRVSGILLLPDGPMMVAASPILKSSGDGPSKGTLILGRHLSANEVHRLSLLTHLDLQVHGVNDPGLPSDFQIAHSNLSRLQPIVIQPVDSSTIAGYQLIHGIDGQPAILLGVRMPRSIHAEGKRTEIYLLGSAMVVGLVFGLVTMFLLERLVLSRLIRLGKDVADIGAHGDLAARVKSDGNDELSQLSDMINRMLANLERVQQERRRDEERYRAYIAHSTEGIWRCELQQPLPISLPEDQQLEHLHRNLYFAECNDALARRHRPRHDGKDPHGRLRRRQDDRPRHHRHTRRPTGLQRQVRRSLHRRRHRATGRLRLEGGRHGQRRRRRRCHNRRLRLEGHGDDQPQSGVADLDAAQGNDRSPARTA